VTFAALLPRMRCSQCRKRVAVVVAVAKRAPVSEHLQSHAAAGARSHAGLTSLGSEPCKSQADHHGFPSRGSPVTISAWKSPCAKVAISRESAARYRSR